MFDSFGNDNPGLIRRVTIKKCYPLPDQLKPFLKQWEIELYDQDTIKLNALKEKLREIRDTMEEVWHSRRIIRDRAEKRRKTGWEIEK